MNELAKIISMTILCFVPDGHGGLRQAWQIKEKRPLDICLTENRLMSGGGRAGVILVKCGDLADDRAAHIAPPPARGWFETVTRFLGGGE